MKISEMGKSLTTSLQGTDPLIVGVLNESFIFYADLVRQINLDVKCEFIFSDKIYEIGFDVKDKSVVLVFDQPPKDEVAEKLKALLKAKGAVSTTIVSK